jgi:serine/threonine-protein kinase
MVHPDDVRMIQRAQILGLISQDAATVCMEELSANRDLRLAQVLLRRRIMKGDIIMALFQQVRDLATTSQGLVGSATATVLQGVGDVIPQVRAGDTLCGFELKREVARGGMGFLFEARNGANERVAVKVLSHEAASSPNVVARFSREGQLASRLSHPNLIKVRQYGFEGGVHFLIMDFFEGKALSDLIRPGRLTPKKALSVMAKVASACVEMHAQNVIHRDIKPANIMVGKGGAVCLTDLGIAKDIARYDSSLTQMGFARLLGTPAYMAPEQARGELDSIGPWSDVYAMGAVVFRALTGKYPFALGAYMKTIDAIAHETAPRISSLRPDAPAVLDGLIFRAMSQETADRPTADEFGQHLARIEQNLRMPPGPPGKDV